MVARDSRREFVFNFRLQPPRSWLCRWLWCGYIDSWIEKEGNRQHTGLKDVFGNPYLPITNAMRKLYGDVYEIHNPKEYKL